MQEMVLALWNALNINFTILGLQFSLIDVFYASLFLSALGFFIGKIILFTLNKR